MFALKKIIASLLNIPGIFIVALFATGVYGFKKKVRLLQLNALLGLLLYLFSISFVADFLIGLTEKNYFYNGKERVDVIVLLGGGVVEGAPDLTGSGVPSPDMMLRLVDAVRLYNKYRLPVITCGGAAEGRQREAHVVKRFLSDLGVPSKSIIMEDRSRDTVENAEFTKEIFRSRGYKCGLLVTSAYHIRRAKYLFEKAGVDVIPHSAGYLSEKNTSLSLYDFIPHPESLRKSAMALREAMGTVFYWLKYGF